MKSFSFQGKRPFHFWLSYVWVLGESLSKYGDLAEPVNLYLLVKNGMADFWFEVPQGEEGWHYKKLFFDYLKRPKKIDKLVKLMNVTRKKIGEFKKWQNKTHKLTDRQLLNLYLLASDLYTTIAFGIPIVRRLDEAGFVYLQRVKKKIKKDFDVYAIATTAESSYLQQEELVFLRKIKDIVRKNLKKPQDKGELNQIIKSHLKEWSWTGCSYADEPPRREKDYQIIAANWLKSPQAFGQRLRELSASKKMVLRKRNQILKTLGIKDKEFLNALYILQKGSFLKDYTRAMVAELSFSLRPIFAEISKRKKIPIEKLRLLTLPEFKKFFKKGVLPKKEILRNREKYYLAYPKNGRVKIVYGPKAEQIEKRYFSTAADIGITELRGNVAYPGKARSKVKIVQSLKDASKFNKGDILVVDNTTPELVPIMKKALAIVTNEGGITSHAAIVSRELKIPCVVGTKIATKIFKDGDKIEVDANKGIVRKI
jgi:phosphoenolpyruvate synthase/pyruvate phosphate dikinase